VLCGSCCAQTGSFEHNSPSSSAAWMCSWMRRPTSIRPPSVPLGIGRAGVEQKAITDAGQGVNPFPDGTGRIATFQGDGRNQQVRERVQKDVRQTGKLAVRAVVLSCPTVEAGHQLPAAILNVRPLLPRLDLFPTELKEDSFTLVLDRRKPRDLAGQCGTPNPNSSSPSMSGAAASNRVKPTCATTSRSR